MGLVEGTGLVILGLAGVASFALRKTGTRMLLLALVQLGLGGLGGLWGWYKLWVALASLEWLSRAPVYWCTLIAQGVLELLLGVLLLVGLVFTVLSRRRDGAARAIVRGKLAWLQLATGILTIAVGVWTVVYGFVFTTF